MNDELEEHKLYGGERSNEPHFSTTSPFKMQLVKLCLKGPRGEREVGRGNVEVYCVISCQMLGDLVNRICRFN